MGEEYAQPAGFSQSTGETVLQNRLVRRQADDSTVVCWLSSGFRITGHSFGSNVQGLAMPEPRGPRLPVRHRNVAPTLLKLSVQDRRTSLQQVRAPFRGFEPSRPLGPHPTRNSNALGPSFVGCATSMRLSCPCWQRMLADFGIAIGWAAPLAWPPAAG